MTYSPFFSPELDVDPGTGDPGSIQSSINSRTCEVPLAYRVITLVHSDDPSACVDPERVAPLLEQFGVTHVEVPESGDVMDFTLPFADTSTCAVQVVVDPDDVDWYTERAAREGLKLNPTPNVYTQWTLSAGLDLDLMHRVGELVTPGVVVDAWDDIQGFGVEWGSSHTRSRTL